MRSTIDIVRSFSPMGAALGVLVFATLMTSASSLFVHADKMNAPQCAQIDIEASDLEAHLQKAADDVKSFQTERGKPAAWPCLPDEVIGNHHAPVMKEVGYLSAINWAFGLGVFFPVMLYFVLTAMESLDKALERALAAGMLRRKKGATGRTADVIVRERWDATLRTASRYVGFLFTVGFLFSMAEWWTNSGQQLSAHSLDGLASGEYDWSVAALVLKQGVAPTPMANGVFSCIVFTLLQGGFIAALGLLITFMLAINNFFSWLSDERKQLKAIANNAKTPNKPAQRKDEIVVVTLNLKSKDPRLGFEFFEDAVAKVLLAASFAFCVFYSSRLWNVFLHNGFDHDVGDFFKRYVLLGLANDGKKTAWIDNAREAIHGMAVAAMDFSSVLVTVAALSVFLIVASLPSIVLNKAANEARENTKKRKLTPANQTKLTQLQTWPLGYPSQTILWLGIVLAVVTMFFYPLGVVFLTMVVVAEATRLFKRRNVRARTNARRANRNPV